MRSEVIRCCMVVACALLWGGCGGGTTGTSSTGVVRLSGSVRGEGGAPVANRPMAVVSANSGELLLDSQTNSLGMFVMILPEGVAAADILIAGASDVRLQRAIGESSLAAASVVVRSQSSADGVAQSALAAQLEARVAGAVCSGSLFTSTAVDVTGVVAGQPCRIELEIAATGVVDTVEITTVCRAFDGDQKLSAESAPLRGVVETDITLLVGSSCSSREVRVSVVGNPDATVVIPVQQEGAGTPAVE